jgi:polar amino acid transport system permease protein
MTVDVQTTTVKPPAPITGRATGTALDALNRVPWWALIVVLLGLGLGIGLATGERYRLAFQFIAAGAVLTIQVSLGSFLIALIVGLIAGLGRVSKNVIFYTLSTLYVEIVRGIPLLVQVIMITYAIVPWLVNDVINRWLVRQVLNVYGVQYGLLAAPTDWQMNIQGVGLVYRAGAALALGYGAYLAEIYRAGIQSISRGQMEAARSLGMTYWEAMRHVILPQAIRVILPPLGNDFIAMLKDSSLISIASVYELTGQGRLYISRTFDTFTGWYVVSYTYLVMTLCLSAVVRVLERRTATPR